jgi:hypothetical protein
MKVVTASLLFRSIFLLSQSVAQRFAGGSGSSVPKLETDEEDETISAPIQCYARSHDFSVLRKEKLLSSFREEDSPNCHADQYDGSRSTRVHNPAHEFHC